MAIHKIIKIEPPKPKPRIPRWKRGIEKPKPPVDEPKEYTPRQVIAISAIRRVKTQLDYSRMKSHIDSDKIYLVPTSYFIPGGHGYRHVKGSELKGMIDKERSEYLKSEVETTKRIRRFHPRGKFKETEEGLEYKPPSVLSWSERKMEKLVLEEHPPFIKDLSYLGFIAGSTILAAGKPVKQFFDFLSGTKPSKYIGDPGIHFVSWIDVPLEPLGLAPKGSTALLLRHPIHAVVGGALGEIPVLFGFGKAVKGFTKATVSGTKLMIGKAPRYFYRVTGKLGLPKLGQKLVYAPRFQTFWQRLYSYSVGKSGFVKAFPMKGLPVIKTEGTIFAKKTIYKGFGKRVLVSAPQLELAKERMMFSSAIYGKYQPILFETRAYGEKITVKGLFRKTITERYLSFGKTIGRDLSGGLSYIQRTQARPLMSGGLHHAGYLGQPIAMLPTQANIISSALSIGLGRLSLGALESKSLSVERVIPKSISLVKSLSLQGLSLSSMSEQMSKQIQAQSYKMALSLEVQSLFTRRARGKSPPVVHPLSIPKAAILLFGERKRKVAPLGVIKPLKIKYHEREHKVLKLEDLL